MAWSHLCPKIESLDDPTGLLYMGMPDMVNRTDWWFNNTEASVGFIFVFADLVVKGAF